MTAPRLRIELAIAALLFACMAVVYLLRSEAEDRTKYSHLSLADFLERVDETTLDYVVVKLAKAPRRPRALGTWVYLLDAQGNPLTYVNNKNQSVALLARCPAAICVSASGSFDLQQLYRVGYVARYPGGLYIFEMSTMEADGSEPTILSIPQAKADYLTVPRSKE